DSGNAFGIPYWHKPLPLDHTQTVYTIENRQCDSFSPSPGTYRIAIYPLHRTRTPFLLYYDKQAHYRRESYNDQRLAKNFLSAHVLPPNRWDTIQNYDLLHWLSRSHPNRKEIH